MDIKKPLVEEFMSELEEVSKMEVGTEKYKIAIEGINKIAEKIIEIDNHQTEMTNKVIVQETEEELKRQQLKDENKDRLIKNCITIGTAAAYIITNIWAYKSNMRYEDKGLIPTTEGGRNSLKNLLRFKL